tara:strand:- start:1667 stop:2152 length:486 start_codon:yes stop_codon:yes gene_type:complete
MDDLIIHEQGDCRAVLSTIAHAKDLAPKLRQNDLIEVAALGFDNAEQALIYGVDHSDITVTALDANSEPFAMFGVGKKHDQDFIWLLGSEGLVKNRFTFLKASKVILPAMMKDKPTVTNLVYAEYEDSINWLNWLGAKFIREVDLRGFRFYEFIIINKDYI